MKKTDEDNGLLPRPACPRCGHESEVVGLIDTSTTTTGPGHIRCLAVDCAIESPTFWTRARAIQWWTKPFRQVSGDLVEVARVKQKTAEYLLERGASWGQSNIYADISHLGERRSDDPVVVQSRIAYEAGYDDCFMDVAASQLPGQAWIPILSEVDLPKEGSYLVSVNGSNGNSWVEEAFFNDEGKWQAVRTDGYNEPVFLNEDGDNVTAYRSLLEPYRGESDADH